MKTVSLFSSYGLGDLGVRASGAEIILMAELLQKRCDHLRRNFPEADIVAGDLSLKECRDDVVRRTKETLKGEPLHLLVATPPCQGMSTNGAAKIARAVEKKTRLKFDPRNRLILPALEIAVRLKPKWIVFENVIPMRNTLIPINPEEKSPEFRKIVDIIQETLGSAGYGGGYENVKFSRYGVPQERTRLITVYGLGWSGGIDNLLPKGTSDPVTLRRAIGHFEKLDARDKLKSTTEPLHHVKKMNDDHYWWTSCIPSDPPGKSAYDNQCECGWISPTKSGKQTEEKCPAYCEGCKKLLPRPTVPDKNNEGRRRIISGFISAYKRMEWDRPAPTVTMNLMTPSSDNKLHPEQNRTLSPAEAAVLQTIQGYTGGKHPGYNYDWGGASDKELCDALGEAVPPLFFEKLARHLAETTT